MHTTKARRDDHFEGLFSDDRIMSSSSSKYLREATLHQETASDVVQPKYRCNPILIGISLSHSMRSFATDRALDGACACCVTVADLGKYDFPASHE